MDLCARTVRVRWALAGLATYFFNAYPAMLASGGWAAVFRRLQMYIVASGACVTAFYVMESRSPTRTAHPELVGE